MFTGWAEALRDLGEEVYTYELDRRLSFFDAALMAEDISTEEGRQLVHKALTREQAVGLAAEGILSACYRAWPHVILLISAFFTPPPLLEMMRGRGHKVVLLHSESPYQDDEQLIRAAHADLNLLNDPSNIAAYESLDAPAAYMPHAYRPSVHYPAPGAAKLWDLAFVGTGFPSRIRFFEQMDLDGLDVYLGGPWFGLPEDSPLRDWTDTDPEGCIDNTETADIYRQACAGLNLYRREAEDAHLGEGWACGPREIEMAACGLWFARDPRPESDELFGMLPAFTGPGEAGELVRWALAHPGNAAEAAGKARAAVADRTFGNHARELLAMLDH
jgi:hypothetical protein